MKIYELKILIKMCNKGNEMWKYSNLSSILPQIFNGIPKRPSHWTNLLKSNI